MGVTCWPAIVTVIPLLSPLAHPPSGQPQGVRIGIGIFNCSSTSPATTYPRCVVYRRRNPISLAKMSGMKRHLEWYTQQRDQPLKDPRGSGPGTCADFTVTWTRATKVTNARRPQRRQDGDGVARRQRVQLPP